jgi:hypothetical protein
MERAAGDEIAAGLPQRHSGADELHDIRAGHQLVDELLWNPAAGCLLGGDRIFHLREADYSKLPFMLCPSCNTRSIDL